MYNDLKWKFFSAFPMKWSEKFTHEIDIDSFSNCRLNKVVTGWADFMHALTYPWKEEKNTMTKSSMTRKM